MTETKQNDRKHTSDGAAVDIARAEQRGNPSGTLFAYDTTDPNSRQNGTIGGAGSNATVDAIEKEPRGETSVFASLESVIAEAEDVSIADDASVDDDRL